MANFVIIRLRFLKGLTLNFYKNFINFIKSQDKPMPVFIKNNNIGPKVHIGAGPINLQGWINIDARPLDHIHIVSKNLNLKEFSNNSIQEIYMCHILEHIPFTEVPNIFQNLYKKLKIGGVLRISVPSFDSMVQIYKDNNNNLNIIKYALMGGQDYEFNFHYSVYNESELTKIFKKNKFINISNWNVKDDFGIDIGDWSSAKFKTKNGKYDISLNLKAIKQ